MSRRAERRARTVRKKQRARRLARECDPWLYLDQPTKVGFYRSGPRDRRNYNKRTFRERW